MQINCPCCGKKIALFKILLYRTSKLYKYPCPYCQQKIQTPWGAIIAFRFISLLLICFIFIDMFMHENSIIDINRLFIITLFVVVSAPILIKYLPFYCNRPVVFKVFIGDKEISIIERDMNEELFYNIQFILKWLFLIILSTFIYNSFFHTISLKYFELFFVIVLIGFSSKKIITNFYIRHFWNKTRAKIVDCKVIHQVDKTYKDYDNYRLSFTYKYEVDQKFFQSKNRFYDSNMQLLYPSIDIVKNELKQYLDSGVDIYYNPKDMSQSYVNTALKKEYQFLYIISLSLGLIWFYFLILN